MRTVLRSEKAEWDSLLGHGFSDPHARPAERQTNKQARGTDTPLAPETGWLRFWDLLGYFFPKRIRELAYLPGKRVLEIDYVNAMHKYQGKWARRYLWTCFAFHTALLFSECLFLLIVDTSLGRVLRLFGRKSGSEGGQCGHCG